MYVVHHITHCLTKDLKVLKIHLANWQTIIYPDDTNHGDNPGQSWFVFIRVSTILDNHMYGLYSLEFQQRDERLDLPSRCSYLACVLTNNVMLLGLPNAHQNIFVKLLTSILLSKHAFRVILRLATLGWSGGNEMWIHYLISKM